MPNANRKKNPGQPIATVEPKGGVQKGQKSGGEEHGGRHEDEGRFEECAALCHECHDKCLHMIPHCLELGGEHALRDHITALLDCAQFCQLAGDLMHRHSPHAAHICGECAEVCNACADSCEKLGTGEDTERHRMCAETCRKCAEVCTQTAEPAPTAGKGGKVRSH